MSLTYAYEQVQKQFDLSNIQDGDKTPEKELTNIPSIRQCIQKRKSTRIKNEGVLPHYYSKIWTCFLFSFFKVDIIYIGKLIAVVKKELYFLNSARLARRLAVEFLL